MNKNNVNKRSETMIDIIKQYGQHIIKKIKKIEGKEEGKKKNCGYFLGLLVRFKLFVFNLRFFGG